MSANYIQLGSDSGGWRDFLDGQPIHCGDQLQLWDGEPEGASLRHRWLYARYEMGDRHLREVVLCSVEGDGRVANRLRHRWLDRDTMRFRWTPPE